MVGKKLGILFLAAVVLAFLSGYFIQNLVPGFTPGNSDDSFDLITDYLIDNYYYELDNETIDQAYIDSLYQVVETYARKNNDPYTRVFAIPQTSEVRYDEVYVGMGISIEILEDSLRIIDVNPESDAFNKVLPNDVIIGVSTGSEDILFDELENSEDMLTYLSSQGKTQQNLIIQTPDGIIETIEILITEIATPSVVAKTIEDPNIGYIKINQFNAFMDATYSPGTSFLFKEALTQLETQKLLETPETKTLILDLRDNPGGALTALHNAYADQNIHIPGIIQELLPRSLEKPIFSMVPRDPSLTRTFNNTRLEKKPYDIKVLVNEHSASASEVLAATLFTNGGYTVYGKPTYGKNVFQSTVTLFNYKGIEYGLTYTEGMWFYDGDKNVMDNPIPVIEINQEGYYTLDIPMYAGELRLDDVSLSLINYQKFFNIYYEDTLLTPLREDGYFDSNFESVIEAYQIEMDLEVTKTLNRETAMSIFETLSIKKSSLNDDIQLQALIDIISNS
jgi:carboxyl-terminal processing protease